VTLTVNKKLLKGNIYFSSKLKNYFESLEKVKYKLMKYKLTNATIIDIRYIYDIYLKTYTRKRTMTILSPHFIFPEICRLTMKLYMTFDKQMRVPQSFSFLMRSVLRYSARGNRYLVLLLP